MVPVGIMRRSISFRGQLMQRIVHAATITLPLASSAGLQPGARACARTPRRRIPTLHSATFNACDPGIERATEAIRQTLLLSEGVRTRVTP